MRSNYQKNLKIFIDEGVEAHGSRAALAAHITSLLPKGQKIDAQLLSNWVNADLKEPLRDDSLYKIGVTLGVPNNQREEAIEAAKVYLNFGRKPQVEVHPAPMPDIPPRDDADIHGFAANLLAWSRGASQRQLSSLLPHLAEVVAIAAQRVHIAPVPMNKKLIAAITDALQTDRQGFLMRSGFSDKEIVDLLSGQLYLDDQVIRQLSKGLNTSIDDLRTTFGLLAPRPEILAN